ncbi:synaptic vesicular amine transporter-like [Asterias amurensis]|uniref:synaptic vesicular amine transporter-like n=1 Tax=Asterias amurensis TaxID=7602 RepID=UPI003AB49047
MGCRKTIQEFRESKWLLVAVVTVAMVFDNCLMTAVVPLLPVVLLGKCHRDSSTETIEDFGNLTSVMDSHDTVVIIELSECEKAVNTNLGLLLASQFVVRMALSPLGGYLCRKWGYFVVMMIGCLLMITSSLVYAFSTSYAAYLVGRITHGFAAVSNEVGGLGVIGYRFRDDDKQRGFVLGFVVCGFAVGSILGPVFGGLLGDSMGPMFPFLVFAGLLTLLLVAQMSIYQPETETEEHEDPMALLHILKSPNALIAAGSLTMASVVFGILEPALPVWMLQTMAARTWQLGAVFIPSGTFYVIACTTMGFVSYRIGRWLCIAVPIFVLSVNVALLPFATSFLKLLVPMAVVGFCFGAVDVNSCAVLFYIAERDFKGAYGAASALITLAFSLGFILGPALSSILLNNVGFEWMLRGLGICTALLTPLCCILRGSDSEPTSSEKADEKTVLILPAVKPDTVAHRVPDLD